IVLFILLNNDYLKFVQTAGNVNNEELYKLLGVSKTATTKQIRVAFKKLALEKHPDKNTNDPNANELFIRINRAYEILKDEELRKKYDQFGEDGLKENQNSGHNYQSWNFYQQNFGIYDDDPEVITLSRSDFRQTVVNSNTIWFINFYSTQCSHCHELAPTWRELAKLLDGVVKIGAVNCMDDWMLCNEERIQAFPSLIMYPKGHRFSEVKNLDNLMKFALSFASGNIHELNLDSYKKIQNSDKPWLLSFCLSANSDSDEELNYELNCLDEMTLRKLAIMSHGLVNVAHIDCVKQENKDLCSNLKPKLSEPIVFYNSLPNLDTQTQANSIPITITNYKKIFEQILTLLPDNKILEETDLKEILENLRNKDKNEKPWLMQFVENYDKNKDLEFKKLPNLLGDSSNFGLVDCDKLNSLELCLKLQINKYPTFVIFKSASFMMDEKIDMGEDNWYEIHYGNRQSAEDLANFVKENAFTPVRTLTYFDTDFIEKELAKYKKTAFFVDFFAPWCPPCMNLLPEFRKSSQLEGSKSTLFGTIDCTINTQICEKFNIRSYPTTILYNNSIPNLYHGHHSAQDISDFIQDILNPSVITLTYDSFYKLVGTKPSDKIWMIDFFASWCGPCQQLAPEWRKLAKRVDKKIVTVAQVDCVIEERLCADQAVRSYPNIRLYPTGSKGYLRFEQFQGWMRDANSLLQWVGNYMPTISVMLNLDSFEQLVLGNFEDKNNNDQIPWIVDFYAPWCGHCQVFAPTFEALASKFEGKVKFGKVNCQDYPHLCQASGIRAYPTVKFYPIVTSNYVNWGSGEELHEMDFNRLSLIIDAKLRQYGYDKKQKIISDKSEL
ncbi:unnamed protein product, partial [Brachionus calyciflorus]